LITFGFGVSSAFAGEFDGLAVVFAFGFAAVGSAAAFFSLSVAAGDFSVPAGGVFTNRSVALGSVLVRDSLGVSAAVLAGVAGCLSLTSAPAVVGSGFFSAFFCSPKPESEAVGFKIPVGLPSVGFVTAAAFVFSEPPAVELAGAALVKVGVVVTGFAGAGFVSALTSALLLDV